LNEFKILKNLGTILNLFYDLYTNLVNSVLNII